MSKNKSKKIDNGRSMIEMLGVLAIIGVLSVGGIAGYSKAMHRYRLNKTIEQITYMAGSIRSFFAPQKSYDGLYSLTATGRSLLKKAKLVLEEMWEEGKNDPQTVWGGFVGIYSDCRTRAECYNHIYKAFMIDYYNIPEEACIDLLSQDWSNAGVNAIRVLNAEHADASLADQNLYITPPVSVDTAVHLCSSNADDEDGIDVFRFYFDIDVTNNMWKSEIDATTALLNGE